MGKTIPKSRTVRTRRSPCPVACALDILGDRWSLLIVRDLVMGRSRFKEFLASPEGIPTNILTERLDRLQRKKIIRQVPSPDGSKHMAYGLTEQGRDLLPILRDLRDWSLKWIPGTEAKMERLEAPAAPISVAPKRAAKSGVGAS